MHANCFQTLLYKNGSDTAYAYAYDDNGNITSITRGSTSVTYQYNGANELVRENNGFTNQTVTYTYDTWGNITEKKIYAYTTATNPGTPTSTIPYVYGNSSWKDQLTKYNGQTISYDAMGNPTTYRGKTLTWNGKELTGVTGTASYTYDMNGLRTAKTVSGTTTNYFYNNTVLMGLTSGSNKLLFSYDASGLVQAVNFNGTYYYYLRNGQEDIVKIIDGTGAAKVEYSYDSWGKKLSCTGTLATTLGKLNPFRYRGYVYDEETGFYYLKSRYYDPETCRFISADVYLSTGQGVLGYNTYVYCGNSPISRIDDGGSFWTEVFVILILVLGMGTASSCMSNQPAPNPVPEPIYNSELDEQFRQGIRYYVIAYEGVYKKQDKYDEFVFPRNEELKRGIHVNYAYVSMFLHNNPQYVEAWGLEGVNQRILHFGISKYNDLGMELGWSDYSFNYEKSDTIQLKLYGDEKSLYGLSELMLKLFYNNKKPKSSNNYQSFVAE